MNANPFSKPFGIATPAPVAVSAAPAADYSYLRQLVFEQSQNVLDPSRDYLFETRLDRKSVV